MGSGLGQDHVPRSSRLRTRFTVGAVLLLATLSFAGSSSPTASPGVSPLTHPAVLRVESGSLCDTLTTNASLVRMVDQHYPNSTLIPSQSTAQASVQSLWGKVCMSYALNSAEAGGWNVGFNVSVFEGEKNVTGGTGWISGSLLVWFHAGWNTSCPATGGPYPAGYGCLFSEDWLGNLSTASLVGPRSQVVSVRLSLCVTLTSNASLVANLAANYPNSHLKPTEAVADANIQKAWGNLCASSEFYTIYTTHGGAGLSLSYWGGGSPGPNSSGPNGTAGPSEQYLFAGFEIDWDAACPSGANYDASVNCSDHEAWTTNLSTGVTMGPEFSAYPLLGGAPCGLCGPSTAQPALASAFAGSWPYLLAGLVLGSVVGIVGLLARRRRRAMPPRVGPPPPPTG